MILLLISTIFIKLRPMRSYWLMFVMHPLLTAHKATSAAAPGNPKHKVQQVWFSFSPHFKAHLFNLSSQPDLLLHFLYWSGQFFSMHSTSSGDCAETRKMIARDTRISFIDRLLIIKKKNNDSYDLSYQKTRTVFI